MINKLTFYILIFNNIFTDEFNTDKPPVDMKILKENFNKSKTNFLESSWIESMIIFIVSLVIFIVFCSVIVQKKRIYDNIEIITYDKTNENLYQSIINIIFTNDTDQFKKLFSMARLDLTNIQLQEMNNEDKNKRLSAGYFLYNFNSKLFFLNLYINDNLNTIMNNNEFEIQFNNLITYLNLIDQEKLYTIDFFKNNYTQITNIYNILSSIEKKYKINEKYDYDFLYKKVNVSWNITQNSRDFISKFFIIHDNDNDKKMQNIIFLSNNNNINNEIPYIINQNLLNKNYNEKTLVQTIINKYPSFKDNENINKEISEIIIDNFNYVLNNIKKQTIELIKITLDRKIKKK